MTNTRPQLRLATRGSPLALWQARRVASLLVDVDVTLITVETEGDRRTDVPLHTLGGQGIFVKEVQAAVLRGEADAAVHSAKDLPSSPDLMVDALTIAAFPERADHRDLLVGGRIDELPSGSVVATGSPRRRVQLANLRPDLMFADLRGNLATRLAQVGHGDIAAVVVAKAAVDRLGWSARDGLSVEVLEPRLMVPQVGQGALAVECRSDDAETRQLLASIDLPPLRRVLTAERAYLAELGGGCMLPVGAWARGGEGDGRADGEADLLELTGMLASDDGRVVLRHEASGTDPVQLGVAVAQYLLGDGGGASLGDWPESGSVGPS